jgi:L-iditol 2-dehydrogenase
MPRAGTGEIVVRVHAALTCGTDLKVYRRGYHARMLKPPIPFGHELAGTVHEAGKGVIGFRKGDRVVALNSAPCGECYFCRRDQENLCDNLLFNNGAYAEFLLIPARIVAKNTLRIPTGIPFEHAALTEALACVVRGLDECEPRKGDTIAIIGAGPIGLMFMHLAELYGMRVIAVVKRDEQVAAARTFGASEVVQITAVPDAIAAVRALTPHSRGVDIAIDAVATPRAWQWAVDMVRKGGTVNFFGGCAAGTKVELDTNRLHYNNITLRASFHHTPAAARKAFDLIVSGRFRSGDTITSRAPLSDLNRVFRQLMNRAGDIKTAIIP